MLFWVAGAGAVGGNVDVEAAHVGVVRCNGDAAVGCESGEDEGFDLKMLEQDFERSHVEGGVHRLQDEIIFAIGKQWAHELAAFGFETAAHQDFFFAAPVAEVVIDVEDGDAGLAGAGFEFDEGVADFEGALEDRVSIGELESGEDVDDQESDGYGRRAGLGMLSGSHATCDAISWGWVSLDRAR